MINDTTVEFLGDKYKVSFKIQDDVIVLLLSQQEFEDFLFKMNVLYTDNSGAACVNT